MTRRKIRLLIILEAGFVAALAWFFLFSPGIKRNRLPLGERRNPGAAEKGGRPPSPGWKREVAGRQVPRRRLGHVRLVAKENGRPLAGLGIVLRKADGSIIETKTSKDGFFPSPPPGEYTVSPKEWGFRPVTAGIEADTRVILVDGLGRVKVALQGDHPGEGTAALVPLGYLKALLAVLESIPDPGVFREKLLSQRNGLKEEWDARAKAIFPGTRFLEWNDVPVGERFILVVSHPRIYLVSPPCPKWTGVLFDLVVDGKKCRGFALPEDDFNPPCPISKSFRLRPGGTKVLKAFFRPWSNLYIYCDSFLDGIEFNIKVLRLQAMKEKGIYGWPSIFDTYGKPRSPVEVRRVFPGEYVVQVSCLYPKAHRIVLSCSHLVVEREKKAVVHVSQGIGPNSFFLSNTSGKWGKDTLIEVQSEDVMPWDNFMGEGGFNLPISMDGVLEVRGVMGKKGQVLVLSPENKMETIDFDLTKSNQLIWKDKALLRKRKR